MRKPLIAVLLTLLLTLFLSDRTFGQQPQTFTWSSKTCSTCESSILNPGWYSDGSGFFVEGIEGGIAGAIAGVTYSEGYFIVAVSFAIEGNGNLTVNPTEAVRLETDSAPHMVLYPVARPDSRKIPKDHVAVKRQFKNKPVALSAGGVTAGYLFFPADQNASRVTVVVEVGNETFRFPFLRNPAFRSKFGDPDTFPVTKAAESREAAPAAGTMFVNPQPRENAAPVRSRPSLAQQASMTGADGQGQFATGAKSGCEKNISFAMAEAGQIVPRVPSFAQKWTKKNQSKHPGLCFSQNPISDADNYLLVFSTSQSAFNGIYPTVHTSTSTNTTPVSGNCTVTDYYGGMWQYSFDGTVTTTTTTTEHLSLPYTDTSNTLYLYSYGQNGRAISQRSRTLTTRQGGDGMNTLGYNLGALLGSIHMKQGLLSDVVKDVEKDAAPSRFRTAPQAPPTSFTELPSPPPTTPPQQRTAEQASSAPMPNVQPPSAPPTAAQTSVTGVSTVTSQQEPETLGDAARRYRELKQKQADNKPEQ